MIGACSRLLGVGGVSARANARYMYLQSGLKKKYPSRRPFWATDLLRSYIRERIHSFPIYRKPFLKVPSLRSPSLLVLFLRSPSTFL